MDAVNKPKNENIAVKTTLSLTYTQKLIMGMILYFIIFSYFASMRYYSGINGDPDYSTFEQCVYTTAYNRKMLYNTFEKRSHYLFRMENQGVSREEVLEAWKNMDGETHFAVHTSPIFYLLVPFYMIYPDLVTLIMVQTLVIVLGAWAVFLIGKEVIYEKAGFMFAVLYLLYAPLHGITYDSFHEFGFLMTPVLFSFYFLLKKRFLPFWICILLSLACKEDVSFLIAGYGLYILYRAYMEKKEGKWEGNLWKNPLILHGFFTFSAGVLWLVLSVFVIIPHFRGQEFHLMGERYGYLGNSFGEVVLNMILKPHLVLSRIFEYTRLTYIVELLAPFAFMSFLDRPSFMVAIPNLVINCLATFSTMHNTGSRYHAPIVGFVVISAILGTANYINKKTKKKDDSENGQHNKGNQEREKIAEGSVNKQESQGYEKDRRFNKVMKIAFFLCIAFTLIFNPSPFRIGWKVPPISQHRRISWHMADQLPHEASVSTQVDLFLYTCNRLRGYVGYREGVEYILLDLGEEGYIRRKPASDMESPEENGSASGNREKEGEKPSWAGETAESPSQVESLFRDYPLSEIEIHYTNKWFSEGGLWELALPPLLKNGEYKVIEYRNGFLLMKKAK